jgi:hypothetical protein
MYAIQTKFNAHRYRSRLEARYAVLLQVCGLPFQYEREGFELESGRYLPDFWLPTKGIWLEVKGWVATSKEKDQCQCLADPWLGDPFLDALAPAGKEFWSRHCQNF